MLRDMDAAALAVAIPAIMADYVDEQVAAGQSRAAAQARADAQHAALFPDDRPAEGQHLMEVVDGDEAVGLLWMGRPFDGDERTRWVFKVEVYEAHRGRGLGRATMEAAEAWTREHGGTRVGLNVFGHNAVARSLYDSLGYQVQSTNMFKDL
ncbi:MAG: GNAT family N-acetyltransferase [Acidimicrobiales bacterium]